MLNTSVFGILVSLKDMADTSLVSLVVFGVGDLLCALPVSAVSEIVPFQQAARIPGAMDGVEGLVNVRGRLLTADRRKHGGGADRFEEFAAIH